MNVRRCLVLLLVAAGAYSAELQHESLEAWRAYVEGASARMRGHLRAQSHFLSSDAEKGAAERLRNGEVLIGPGNGQGMKKIPSGLIHDWQGAVFMARATVEGVLSVIRDYDEYKEFYPPTVLASRTLEKGGQQDRFSMLLMNKSAFTKLALDSEYRCSSVRVDAKHWYSISETTRIQEVEQYGTAEQRAMPEGEGNGLIWRLFSVTRLEERDGGVYMELEAIALSRDIPGSLRWLVEPIVRRVSKNALTNSLRQTSDAVHSREGYALRARASRGDGQGF